MLVTRTHPEIVTYAVAALTDDLRRPKYRGNPNRVAGHCYVLSEALYHLLVDSTLSPRFIRHEGEPHWFLSDGKTVLDATASQFRTAVPYEDARRAAFLTRLPSRRAQILMDRVRKNLAKQGEI